MSMKRILGAAAAVALLGGAGFVIMGKQADESEAPGNTALPALGVAEAADGTAALVRVSTEANADGIHEMVLGAEDAPVTIIEYASYTCPHCATFHDTVFKQIKEDYVDTGKVRFVYREVFFDRFGLWASMVARCGGPERFFGITDLIYDGQATWTAAGEPGAIADELRKIGRLAGLGADELEACLTDGDKAQALVAWFETNQQADNIRSTPSFIINGELYGNMRYSEFQEIIDAALEG